MKTFLSAAFISCATVVFSQAVPAQQPVEEQYRTNHLWWVVGVLLAIGAGVAVYFLIKKDPRRDVVR
ncbi:hypothetical protein [Segetibacter sp.]|jgi:hypothetical protein|uniref:hypothetical protein n=1 Tax=Segetibacter sp. TaxID=2231182 RepID=UPI00260CE58D|nr:hypothetical protein [Segetibacter sp.]